MWHIRMGVVLMAASAVFLAAQDPPTRVGRLSYHDGPVSFQPAGFEEWMEADINRPLTTGDYLWVGDRGRAEFHVGSTALRLSARSDFQFLNLDDEIVQIRLSEGTLTVRLRNLGRDQVFEVDTPNLAFTIARPGVYRIDANPDSQTTIVTVRDGEGEVIGGGQSFPIYSRQRVVVRGDDDISYNLAPAGGLDAFDQWGSSRDLREDRSLSARYVSREIPGYQDFDQYGRWGTQPGYGQVWMPTTVAAGWAPYRDGHWAWIAPWGWTWVDDAPWGFAPYHYGRWASFGGRWGWIPGPYDVTPIYAPALVGWIGGGRGGSGFSLSFSIGNAAAVGWFPLGPREPYFPSYQTSQGYFTRVNNTNTVINNTTINNYYNTRNSSNSAIPYVNRRVQNGVTAVPQNTFASGRQVNQVARAVPVAQLAAVQVAAAPPIAPQRASVLGARADTTSRAARPPADAVSRRVVARTPPPPAAVPFDRQQAALDENPGRPLPPTEVRQMRQAAPARSAPVRIVDMDRVKRVQPAVAAEPQRGQQPNVPQPAVIERKNAPPVQQRQQQQQDVQQQKQVQDVQRQQQQDTQRQQQQKEQQDVQRVQQQRQQQDTQRQQQQQQKEQQDVQRIQQQKQQQDAQRQQQQKEQQDVQRVQQQRQQQDTQRQQQQQQKEQQDVQRIQQQKQQQDSQRQQQQKEQQDVQRVQQQRQQQDTQRQQQQQQKEQQDVQRIQQQKQQQDAQRQQQKEQQDVQRVQQQRQQQDTQRQQQQQQKEQQDVQRIQQQKQQQDAQRQQQQKEQRDVQLQQQQKQQQDAQRQQEQRQLQDARKQQQRDVPRSEAVKPPAPTTKPEPRPGRGKKQDPASKDEEKSKE